MNNIEKLAQTLGTAVKEARNGGIAQSAIYNDGQVIVNGRVYETEIIVPIIVQTGQKVYVQISAGDKKAYIIG